jgi:hypothetical protein
MPGKGTVAGSIPEAVEVSARQPTRVPLHPMKRSPDLFDTILPVSDNIGRCT